MTEFSGQALYLDYAVPWRSGSGSIGRHGSRASGAGGHFRVLRPFWQVPDARRIDVRRSLTDPFGDIMVRQTEQRSAINLIVAADFSASMQAETGSGNFAQVAVLAEAAAGSAYKAGDAFGFLGFDTAPRLEFYLPPTRGRSAAADILGRLRRSRPHGRGSAGILDLARLLPTRRSLVLLISDFLMPPDVLEAALAGLAAHDVAPVVLHEPREQNIPFFGLLRMDDAERGWRRLVVMRPSLRRRWLAARAARREAIDAVFARHGRAAFHVVGKLDIAQLGAHLLAC